MTHAENLTPDEARTLAAQGELTIIDIRLPVEWERTGVPEGALAIALICARGHRSAFARQWLLQSGFTNVCDISEGMIGGEHGPGWLARDLPTEPCTL